jgi:uncharacterized protein (DUF362 family)
VSFPKGKAAVAITQNTDVRKAVKEAFQLIGGIEKAVRPGSKVLVKPNACLPASPDSGVVTNFRVVEAIIREVKRVGGIPVVGESSIKGTPPGTEEALRASGIYGIAERLKAEVVNFDEDEELRVNIPKGRVLKNIGIAKTALECDVKISVPVLKFHGEARVTLSLKNMKGCLPGGNKVKTHNLGLDQSIADYNTVLKPDVAVIDGTFAGAWGKYPKPVRLNAIIASFDPVAADAVGSLILGVNPGEVKHIRYASEMGLGVSNLDCIEIVGVQLERIALKQ